MYTLPVYKSSVEVHVHTLRLLTNLEPSVVSFPVL